MHFERRKIIFFFQKTGNKFWVWCGRITLNKGIFYLAIVLVQYRKTGNRPDMAEKLLIWT